MNCQAKIRLICKAIKRPDSKLSKAVILALVVFGLYGNNALAQPHATSTGQIASILSYFPRWTPSYDVTEKCKLTFSSPELNPQVCEASYKLTFGNKFLSHFHFNFPTENPNQFQKLNIEIQPGLRIRGLLGLHPGQKKPLVIFRLGIHGNIDEMLAERYLVSLLYQDLGYHVLVLESLTSSAFIKNNEQLSGGGMEEGLHTFFVLNQITRNKYVWAKQVSEIYLSGISMSGPGMFLTTYLDEQYQHQIKAVQMFCPLVNFEKTARYHSQPGLKSAFIDVWNRFRLGELMEKDPDLQNIPVWKTALDLKPRFSMAVFDWLDQKVPQPVIKLETFKKEFPGITFPKEFEDHLKNSKNFFELNNFWPIFKNTKTPINIVLSADDPIVINDLNSELIRKGQQAGEFQKLYFTDVKGIHCGLSSVYQWPFLIELVRRGLK